MRQKNEQLEYFENQLNELKEKENYLKQDIEL